MSIPEIEREINIEMKTNHDMSRVDRLLDVLIIHYRERGIMKEEKEMVHAG